MDEDNQAICDALCDALALTSSMSDLESIEWLQDSVRLTYHDKRTDSINVDGDTGIVLIADIIEGVY